jgi:Zn-dependent protease
MTLAALILWMISTTYVSVMVHELGHAYVGRASGWIFVRFERRWYGMACVMDMNGKPEALPRIAAGGLVATLMLTAALFVGAHAATGMLGMALSFAFVLNAILLATNLVPLRGLDAGQMIRRIT